MDALDPLADLYTDPGPFQQRNPNEHSLADSDQHGALCHHHTDQHLGRFADGDTPAQHNPDAHDDHATVNSHKHLGADQYTGAYKYISSADGYIGANFYPCNPLPIGKLERRN